MSQDPAADLADFLADVAGLGTVGTDIFVGPVAPASAHVPVNALFLLSSPGRAPDRTHDLAEDRYPWVQVSVRASAYAAGHAKARAVRDALARAKPAGYWELVLLQSEPAHIGEDEKGFHRFALDVEARYQWRPT